MGIYQEHEEVLDWILNKTKAKIVITSTWRKQYTLDEFRERVFSYYPIGKSIIDVTPTKYIKGEVRGDQIQRWLDETDLDIEEFIIIDDDSDMENLMNRLIKTDNKYGLTYVEALEIVKALNNEKTMDILKKQNEGKNEFKNQKKRNK